MKTAPPLTHLLQWFEDAVAVCDVHREIEAAVHLYQVPTLAAPIEGTWVKAVRCGDHGALVAGRTAYVGPHGIEFLG